MKNNDTTTKVGIFARVADMLSGRTRTEKADPEIYRTMSDREIKKVAKSIVKAVVRASKG